jgi:arylsulfatase A-like enzyme
VPLILKPPQGWSLPTTQVVEPVELVDLLPTLCALCSIPVGGDLDGRSLLPTLYRGVRGRDYLVAQTSFEEAPAFRSSPAKRTLLRPGRWQVIHDVDRSEAEFFALDQDPLGLSAHSIRPDEFSPLLDVLLERAPDGPRAVLRPAATVDFSPELLHELDHLGYGAATLAGQAVKGDLR